MSRQFWCLAVFASSLLGQHIRGLVLEPGTDLPVAEAVVTVRKASVLGAPVPPGPRDDSPLDVVTTGPDGSFSLDLPAFGSYTVETHKDGYVPSGPLFRAPPTSVRVELRAARPDIDLRFLLSRSARLSGQVVDEATGRPIPRLLMNLLHSYFEGGMRRASYGVGLAVSGADGKFTVKSVRPGDFLIEIQGLSEDLPTVLQEFTAADLKRVDMGYRRTYWPGGHDVGTASPMPVFSGTSSSIGTLALRKEPLYRVHVSFAHGSCAEGQWVELSLRAAERFATDTLKKVACGKGALLTGLSPGSYKLLGYAAVDYIESVKRGAVDLRISDSNVDVVMPLVGGVDVAGRVVVPEGVSAPALEQLSVRLRARYRANSPFENITVAVDESGRFGFFNREAGEQDLLIQGVPNTHYVKEIRLAGAVVKGEVVSLSAAGLRQSLEIVIDDKPVTIGGTVRDRDQPVSEAFVALARSPFTVAEVPYRLITTTALSDGTFRFAGLAPGEYYVIAVPLASRYQLDDPAVLGSLLSKAKILNLEPRGFQNVTMDVLKP